MNDVVVQETVLGGVIREIRDDGTEKNPRAYGSVGRRSIESQDRYAEILTGAGLLLATVVVLGLGVVLVWFAILRENQVFWTNAGGYPIWLRDLVLWSYLPLFGGVGLSLAALSMACFSRVCRSLSFFVVEGLLLLMCWGLLATTSYIAFSNNIMNIIEGRNVHYHPH